MNEQITMALAAVRDAGSLPVTWNTIDECTREVLAWKNTIGLGVLRVGQALNWAKAKLPHGEFTSWLKDTVDISQSTAQNFMRIAREVVEGEKIAQLPYTKILALLDVPREEREAFAETIGAEHRTAAEIKRLVRELDEARANNQHQQEIMLEIAKEHDRIGESNAELHTRVTELTHKNRETAEELRIAKEQLENARQALALERRKEPETKVIEKMPNDYVQLKQKLSAAEREADRLADELDRVKTERVSAEMNGEDDPSARVLSAIGGFMTQVAAVPQRIRDGRCRLDEEAITVSLTQIHTVETWCQSLREAILSTLD